MTHRSCSAREYARLASATLAAEKKKSPRQSRASWLRGCTRSAASYCADASERRPSACSVCAAARCVETRAWGEGEGEGPG